MASVWAFQPRKSDPPHFVAEDAAELYDRIGEFIGGEQCDNCGNHSYRLGAIYGHRWIATCAVDPDEDPEFRHPEPCGTHYTVRLYDENEVTF
jgi:hypothetical protein